LLLKLRKVENNDLVIAILIHLLSSSLHYLELCGILNYTYIPCTIIYRCNERKSDQVSLWEKKRHTTNTKIKTLGNKVNSERKNWE
jgi:hypothetical protein